MLTTKVIRLKAVLFRELVPVFNDMFGKVVDQTGTANTEVFAVHTVIHDLNSLIGLIKMITVDSTKGKVKHN